MEYNDIVVALEEFVFVEVEWFAPFKRKLIFYALPDGVIKWDLYEGNRQAYHLSHLSSKSIFYHFGLGNLIFDTHQYNSGIGVPILTFEQKRGE